MNVDVGQIIAGKYELVRLLGKGAMGEVWLATHDTLGGQFAIKLVETTDDVEAETAAGRFQLEAQIAAKLSRKTRHVVSVSDHGEENGLAYLVMELLEGESLDTRTKRGAPLALPEVAAIVLQIVRALSLAHEEGVFHRDLKPANVWLGKDEDGCLLVKLLDFGIARTNRPVRTRSPFATSKDMVLGTPSYMSPEQARGLDSLDHRCDLWALAVVAYEALTKTIPFEGETVEDIFLSICTFRAVPARSRRPDLSAAVDAFFARAFAPKIDARFASAAALSEAFEALVSPEELDAALGIPLVPTSARRLEAARARARAGSDPHLAAAARLVETEVAREAPPATTESAESEPEPLALVPAPRQRRKGVLFAIAGAVALLCIGILGAVALRGPSAAAPQATSAPPPDPTTVTTGAATTGEAPTAITPRPLEETQPEAPRPTEPAAAAAAVRAKPKPPSRGASVATPPRPAPNPAPAKTVNKGEVF